MATVVASVGAKVRRLLRSGYWGEAEGRAAVAAWRASGESLAGFCRRHGVSAQRIRWWRDRGGGRAGRRSEEEVKLLPVAVVGSGAAAAAAAGGAIEIDVVRRAVLAPRGVDPETLATVLRAVEAVWRC
jgi:transposase-like protein